MIWKDIPNLEGRYQINTSGDIRSVPHKKTQGRLLKQQTVMGYRVFCHSIGYKRTKLMKVHRAVAMAFIPNPKNKPQVNHKDGNKLNNSVDNLEWVTASENVLHSHRTGLKDSRGEKHSQHKLMNAQVLEIRANAHLPRRELADRYGVASTTVSGIITRHHWKHLKASA